MQARNSNDRIIKEEGHGFFMVIVQVRRRSGYAYMGDHGWASLVKTNEL